MNERATKLASMEPAPAIHAPSVARGPNAQQNKLLPTDAPVHDWYRFVLSFPPHLVREYLNKLGADRHSMVLDPFCGTGTTIVECKKLSVRAVGIEANPMAHFAGKVKLDWSPGPEGLLHHAETIARQALRRLDQDGVSDQPFFSTPAIDPANLKALPQEQMDLLLKDSISPIPLHKTLVLLEAIKGNSDARFKDHERLALANALVTSVGNLHFGPEVGVTPPKHDHPVVALWLALVRKMADDLRLVRQLGGSLSTILRGDARLVGSLLEPNSVDIVFTSPPYPNEKDYTRTTRLESVILGFVRNKKQLRAMKELLIRSNTRNVFVKDDDDRWVRSFQRINLIAEAIEAKRVSLGKTSGFERLYSRVARLYFGGMARHLAELRVVLKPGAKLAYVVGDQASYLRVMIRTGALLAEVATSLGYEVMGIDLFRTRLATATREQLREEVVLLRWPGRPR